jgi:hypothetical protein
VTFAVGTTTTGAPGTAASVTDVGCGTAHILNFVIPQGAVGPTGPTGPDRQCSYVEELGECSNDVKIVAKINELIRALRDCGLMEC